MTKSRKNQKKPVESLSKELPQVLEKAVEAVDTLLGPQAKTANAAPKAQMQKKKNKEVTIQNKIKRIDTGPFRPAEFGTVLSFIDALNFIEATMAQYAMLTNLFVNTVNSTTNGTNILTPSTFVMYCLGLLFTWIDKHGNLGGSNKNDVCRDPDDLAVPLGLAKYFQYLAPYFEDGARGIIVSDLSYTITTSATAYPDPGLLPAGFARTNMPAYLWNVLLPYTNTNSLGEYTLYSATDNLTLANLWSSRARSISKEISAASLAFVSFKSIPTEAPDASAHSLAVGQLLGSSVVLSAGPSDAQWENPFRNYNAEVSLLFASGRPVSPSPLNPVSKPIVVTCPCPEIGVSDAAAVPGCFFGYALAYPAAHLSARQTSFFSGPFISTTPSDKTLVYGGAPVKTLSPSYQVFSPPAMGQMIAELTREMIELTSTPWTVQNLENFRVLTLVVAYTMLQLKMNESSPIPHFTNVGGQSPQYTPQTYFVESDWSTYSVPAMLQTLLSGIAPVNVAGTIVYPSSRPPADSYRGGGNGGTAQNLPVGPLRMLIYAAAYGDAYDRNDRWLTTNYSAVPSSQTAPQIYLNGTLVNFTSVNNHYTQNNTGNYIAANNFVNTNKASIVAMWKGTLQNQLSGASVNQSYVQQITHKLGTCDVMLTQSIIGVGFVVHQLYPEQLSADYNYQFPYFEAQTVGSLVALPKSCAALSVAYNVSFNLQDNTAINSSKYIYSCGSGTGTSALFASMQQRTFGPDSAYAQAAQASREKAAARKGVMVAGHYYEQKNTQEKDWAKRLIHRIASDETNALQPLGRTFATAACNVALPGSGALCGTAADMALNAVRSWIGVATQDGPPLTSKSLH